MVRWCVPMHDDKNKPQEDEEEEEEEEEEEVNATTTTSQPGRMPLITRRKSDARGVAGCCITNLTHKEQSSINMIMIVIVIVIVAVLYIIIY